MEPFGRPSRPVDRSVAGGNDEPVAGHMDGASRGIYSSFRRRSVINIAHERGGEDLAANEIVAERMGADRDALRKIRCDAILHKSPMQL